MMNEKAALIEWIHRAEYDMTDKCATKRRPSLVTEVYFEHQLSKVPTLGLPDVLTTGWMRHWDRGKKVKQWFKIASDEDGKRKETSYRFIKEITKKYPTDEFYLVEFFVNFIDAATTPNVEFTFKPIKLELSTEVASGKKLEQLKLCIEEKEKGKSVSENCYVELMKRKDVDPGNDIETWLSLLEVSALKKLFATRCLMNFGKFFFTDIDGVGVDGQGRMTLVEFKRKDPAKGRRYVLRSKPDFSKYLREADQRNFPDDKNPREPDFDCSKGGEWIEVQSLNGCFGVDTSHAKNVKLCEDLGWKYHYVIWDQAKATPQELFENDFGLRSDAKIRSLVMTSRVFSGIAKAPESGTFTKGKPRYQLMVEAENFVESTVKRTELVQLGSPW